MPVVRESRNVMVGTADLFVAPGDTANALDTLAVGAGYPSPWVHPGYTEEGNTLSMEADVNQHRVEEEAAPVRITVNSKSYTISTTFAEDTLENMKMAAGAGTITTSGTTPPIKELKFSDSIDTIALGLEGRNAQGRFRRFYMPRAVSAGTVELGFRRSESKHMFAASFQSICPSSQISVKEDATAA